MGIGTTTTRTTKAWVVDLAVELGHPNSWYKLLNKNDKVLGIDSFGESAPANVLLEHFGFTIPNVVDIAKSLVDA